VVAGPAALFAVLLVWFMPQAIAAMTTIAATTVMIHGAALAVSR
jgi:hypothetical protein